MSGSMEYAHAVDSTVKEYLRKSQDLNLGPEDESLQETRRLLEKLLTQEEDPYADVDGRHARQWVDTAMRSLEVVGETIPEAWLRWVRGAGDQPDLTDFYRRLRNTDVRVLRAAIRDIDEGVNELPEDRYREVAEALSSLFYIDKYDRPDLQTAVDDALVAVSHLGEPIIPFLVEKMCESDMNATLCYCRALGRIGGPAIPAIMAAYDKCEDPHVKASCLYALSKIRDANLSGVLDKLVEALSDENYEVRVAAGRCMGKYAEVIPSLFVPRSVHKPILKALLERLDDPNAGVRAKAVRSIGKLAKFCCLEDDLRQSAREKIAGLVREGEKGGDPAFLVRQEAEEALQYT